jgi:hypothetical protein
MRTAVAPGITPAVVPLAAPRGARRLGAAATATAAGATAAATATATAAARLSAGRRTVPAPSVSVAAARRAPGGSALALWAAVSQALAAAGAGQLMSAHQAAQAASGSPAQAYVQAVARGYGLRLDPAAAARAAAALAQGDARAFVDAMSSHMTDADYVSMVRGVLAVLLGHPGGEMSLAMCRACTVSCGLKRSLAFKKQWTLAAGLPAAMRKAVTTLGRVMDRGLRAQGKTLAGELHAVTAFWTGYGVDAKLLGVQNQGRWRGNGAAVLRLGVPVVKALGSATRQKLLGLLLGYVINGILFDNKSTAELKYNVAAIEATLFGPRFSKATSAFLRGKGDDLASMDVVPLLAELAAHFAEHGSWLRVTTTHGGVPVPACGVCTKSPGYSRCRVAWAAAKGPAAASSPAAPAAGNGPRNRSGNTNAKTPRATKNSHPINVSAKSPRNARLGVRHDVLKRRGAQVRRAARRRR